MGKAHTIADHAGHGVARGQPRRLIGPEACVDPVHEASIVPDCRTHPHMIAAFDPDRCQRCTSAA